MTDYRELLGDKYEALYARYLEDPGRLLRSAPFELTPNMRLLDLCSGSGALVRAAIDMGLRPINVYGVEPSEAMYRGGFQYTVFPEHVEDPHLHKVLKGMGFHLITCRQAVNYWWGREAMLRVCMWLLPDGAFIFNTFNTCPAEVPQTKQYIYQDHQFAEIAYCIRGQVHHVQAREGMPMHMTTFQWVLPEEFASDLDLAVSEGLLSGWRRNRQGTTDTYVCHARKA